MGKSCCCYLNFTDEIKKEKGKGHLQGSTTLSGKAEIRTQAHPPWVIGVDKGLRVLLRHLKSREKVAFEQSLRERDVQDFNR